MSAMLHLPARTETRVHLNDDGQVIVTLNGAPETGECYTGVTVFFPDLRAFDAFVNALAGEQQALHVKSGMPG